MKQGKRPTKKQKQKQAAAAAAVADLSLIFDSPESSLITKGHYDPLSLVLTVEFTSGKTYTYAGVTSETWAEMLAAESKGKFFNARIRPFIVGREVH